MGNVQLKNIISNNKLFNTFFTILLSIFICYLLYNYVYDGTIYIKSGIDGKSYKVRRGFDMQKKADNLAIINLKLNYLVQTLKNDTRYNNQSNVKRLINNWGDGIDIKEIGNFETDAAYVINKKNMSFCLRTSPIGGKLEELNKLTYVAIHEISHIMSEEIGHGDEFTDNMKFLLDYSKTLNPSDSRITPFYIDISTTNDHTAFCSVEIGNSPT